MNKEVCFTIDSNKLFLEKNLVDYNGVPVFFICKDSIGRYYIVLCIDIEEEKYLIAATTVHKLVELLRQKMTMRDLILKGENFWEVTAGDTLEEDCCVQKDVESINMEDLPYENSYFKVITKEHEYFLNELENLLYTSMSNLNMKVVLNNEDFFESYSDFMCFKGSESNKIKINEVKKLGKISMDSLKGAELIYGKGFTDSSSSIELKKNTDVISKGLLSDKEFIAA